MPPRPDVSALSRAQSLLELGALALEHGFREQMNQPAKALWGAVEDPELADRLRAILSDCAESPLLRVLEDRDVWQRLKSNLSGRHRSELLRAARRLIEGSVPEAGRAPAARVDLPPAREPALWRWAEERGVSDLLECPASMVEPSLPPELRSRLLPSELQYRTIRQLVTGETARDRRFQDPLQPHAAAWLAAQAQDVRVAQQEERAAVPLAPAPSGVLAELDSLLQALRIRARNAGAPPSPRAIVAATRVQFQADPPQLHAMDPRIDFGRRTHGFLPLGLQHWREGRVGWTCPCSPNDSSLEFCRHLAAAVDAARLWIRSGAPQVESMAKVLGAPPWMQTLSLLAQAKGAPEAEQPRLAWRVGGEDRVEVFPYVQKPTRRGGYSAGSRAPLSSVLDARGGWVTAADRRAAAALVGDVYGRKFPELALLALAGAPNVFLEADRDVQIEVAEAELGLRCNRVPGGGFGLVPFAGGSELPLPAVRLWAGLRADRPYAAYLDAASRRCLVIRLRADALSALDVLRGRGAQFPADAGDALVEQLSDAAFPTSFPEELLGEELPAASSLSVFLSPRELGAYALELRVRALPGALPLPVGEGPEVVRGREGARRVWAKRDFGAERAAAGALWAKLELAVPPGSAQVELAELPALEAVRRLEALSKEGLEVVWPQRRPTFQTFGARDLKVQVREGRDWFGLAGGAQIDQDRVDLALLLDAARRRQRYVRLADSHWAELTEELQAALAPLAAVVVETKNGTEVSLGAAPLLEALEEQVAEVEACQSFRALAQRIRASRSFEPEVPRDFHGELRPYQRDGFLWLARLAQWGAGACLADDMGLGKTLQALALLLHRKERGPQLVVAPTSVCFNWEREAARFAPSLRFHSYHRCDREKVLGSLGPGDVLVASYGLLARGAERLGAVRFATLVLDEAHAVKNSAAQRARAVRSLSADFRLALTGTPLENHLGELWSLFRAAVPGLLGSEVQFRERFWTPIERHRDASCRNALSRILRPFLLRRTKGEVARDLPARTEVSLDVALTPAERRLYEEARLAAIGELAGADGGPPEQRTFKVLAALTRLRLLACHPALHDPSWRGPASKLDALLGLVGELREEGHRALVFSQFTKHLEKVREALDERGVGYLYLDGATPERERQARVDRFQGGEGEVFLISLKAGGTGLNLTAADYVIHLDPWWNPAVEDQATDRAHRIGQTRPVTVYRLVTKGTIEEAILALHAQKRELVAGVLEGTDVAARLGTEELAALLERSAVDNADEETLASKPDAQ